MEIQDRLKKLGITVDQPVSMIVEDLLNLSEHLCSITEETERERFEKELNRILKPTN